MKTIIYLMVNPQVPIEFKDSYPLVYANGVIIQHIKDNIVEAEYTHDFIYRIEFFPKGE